MNTLRGAKIISLQKPYFVTSTESLGNGGGFFISIAEGQYGTVIKSITWSQTLQASVLSFTI